MDIVTGASPEIMRALHEVLLGLRRDLEQSRQVQKDTLAVLRDIARELEYLRTERERMARVDRLLAKIDERQARDDRIEKMIDDAARAVAGKDPTVDDGGASDR